MKPVILAEKPSQALEYAKALQPSTRKEGYIEVGTNSIFPNGAIITWGFGHLLELAKPGHYEEKWEKWNLESLPIKPKNFDFIVSPSKIKQFKIIERLFREAKQIIIATDCDREGENIAWSIIKEAKAEHKEIKRLWFNSLEVDVLQNAFKNLKNGQDYYSSYIEAQTRQISDWLIGMNASQLYSLMLQTKGIKQTFSVGRVQTPTLYMIYQREKEIENFVSKPFYEPTAEVKHPNGTFTVKAEGKYDSKQKLLEYLKENNLKLNEVIMTEITKVKKSLEKESSPRLYTMSGIQTKANKQWKYSPANVLKIVQGLYEKKLLSYPRTDTPHITENEFDYLKKNLGSYQKIIGVDFPCYNPEPNKRYVDNSKVQEHYAIIPTKNIPSDNVLNGLSQEEKNIYYEVVMNTIAMFHEPYKFNKTVIEIHKEQLIYKTTGKVEVSKGWKSIYPANNEKTDDAATPLPDVDEGDPIQLIPSIKEGKTTKPKRLTEGELIPLMINSGKLLEGEEQDVLKGTEGIGTEATRSNIIETLKDQKYIEIKKNLVNITSKGVILSEVVDGTLLSSPSLTAKWETFLRLIGKGERKQEVFLSGIYQFIDKLIKEVPEKMNSEKLNMTIEKSETEDHLGKCPNCSKGFIVSREKFYGCTEHKDGCKQTFSKKLLQKTITEAQMKKLLSKSKTDVIKGFKGKKPFDAYLTFIDDTENKIKKYNFNFEKK